MVIKVISNITWRPTSANIFLLLWVFLQDRNITFMSLMLHIHEQKCEASKTIGLSIDGAVVKCPWALHGSASQDSISCIGAQTGFIIWAQFVNSRDKMAASLSGGGSTKDCDGKMPKCGTKSIRVRISYINVLISVWKQYYHYNCYFCIIFALHKWDNSPREGAEITLPVVYRKQKCSVPLTRQLWEVVQLTWTLSYHVGVPASRRLKG